jgi:nucleoside 2-deoxyribosyltransferase
MKNHQEVKTVYFAGKVTKDGYRQKLFFDKVMSSGHSLYGINGGYVIYGGPFALSCDHGCFHAIGRHGVTGSHLDGDHESCEGSFFDEGIWVKSTLDHCGISPQEAVERCINQIQNADAVHAYIDTISCYGTLAELGYASAFRKPIYIYYKENVQNWDKHFWFIFNLPGVVHCGPGTETSIHPDCLTYQKSYKERYHDYLNSFQWKRLRKEKLHEAGGRCQLCNSSEQPIHVHHRTYDRVFHEELSDLIALCKPCHEKFHDIEIGIFE